MSQPELYDDLVLGSGAGGKLLSWHLARSGRRVAVVERRYIGGSCPNTNCLPSKNEIWSAKVADLVHHAAQFGMVTGPVALDMAKVRQRKREMVEGLIAMHLKMYRQSGAELIMGDGKFVAPKTLEVRLRDGGGTRALRGERTTRDRLIPYCLFTDPQLARVGLSESEARSRGVAARVARLPMAAVFRAQTTGETRGFMKALIDARTDRILGFTMFGPEAGEVMAVVQTAMLAGMPYTGLRDAILAHPTMAEGLRALFAQVPPSPAN